MQYHNRSTTETVLNTQQNEDLRPLFTGPGGR